MIGAIHIMATVRQRILDVVHYPGWTMKIDAFVLMLIRGIRRVNADFLVVSDSILSDRLYEFEAGDWETWVKRVLKPARYETVFDIGAGYGRYLPYLAKSAALVVCFEPRGESYAKLKRRSKEYTNVIVRNCAIGNRRDKVALELSSNPDMSRVVDSPATGEFAMVDQIPLDAIIGKEIPVNRIDWMKIDVEGHELQVLTGGMKTILTYHPKIIIEVHSRENRDKLVHILRALGYSYRVIRESVQPQRPYHGWLYCFPRNCTS